MTEGEAEARIRALENDLVYLTKIVEELSKIISRIVSLMPKQD